MKHPDDHIFEHTHDSLVEWCLARRLPRFRADQILQWVYEKGIVDPAAMSSLALRERDMLAREMTFLSGAVAARQEASDGTLKLLVEWSEYAPSTGSPDALPSGLPGHAADSASDDDAPTEPGPTRIALPLAPGSDVLPTGVVVGSGGDVTRQTECVMIPSLDGPRTRRTACISSQVGCPVGCRFCASGIGGLDGNLSAGRIVEQVYRLDRLVKERASGTTAVADGVHEPDFEDGHVEDDAADDADAPEETGAQPKAESHTRSGARIARAHGASGGSAASGGSGPSGASGGGGGGGGSGGVRPPRTRITNVVFMGMGEPLANFANVTRAIRILNAPWGLNISARKITISTVGLPRAIERLAATFELPVTLALSLHAPNDEIRRSLIPWAEYTTIDDLLGACRKWFEKTGREITLEYTLLRGVNDRPEHAAQLARLARTLRANVNLIRYNEVAGMPFQRPRTEDVLAFQAALRQANVSTHIRASRGRDIQAACGQLRHEHAR